MGKTQNLLLLICVLFSIMMITVNHAAAQSVETTGIVKYYTFEGGFYGIAGDDGVNYDPVNLEQAFKIENLKIAFKGKIRNDVMSTRNWGTILEISDIKELGAPPLLEGYEIYEWGVMVGCKDDELFLNTSRPEVITIVKQPVIYVHSKDKKPFDLKVTFNYGKPFETYPDANTVKNTSEWKNVKFPMPDKSLKTNIDTGRLVPLRNILGILNNVDADELEYKGEKSRFLYYEGEMPFSNKVIANYDAGNREVTITNNFGYTIYNVVYSTSEGDFIHPVYLFCVAEEIKSGESVTLKVGMNNSPVWTEDLNRLGFTKMESKSFSQLWEQTFLEKSNTNNWANIIYRIPQNELEKLITLDFNPAPVKVTRVLYVLVHLTK